MLRVDQGLRRSGTPNPPLSGLRTLGGGSLCCPCRGRGACPALRVYARGSGSYKCPLTGRRLVVQAPALKREVRSLCGQRDTACSARPRGVKRVTLALPPEAARARCDSR